MNDQAWRDFLTSAIGPEAAEHLSRVYPDPKGDRLGAQIVACGEAPSHEETFLMGVKFCVLHIRAAAAFVRDDIHGETETKDSEGNVKKHRGSIVRSGQPAFADALERLADALTEAAKEALK